MGGNDLLGGGLHSPSAFQLHSIYLNGIFFSSKWFILRIQKKVDLTNWLIQGYLQERHNLCITINIYFFSRSKVDFYTNRMLLYTDYRKGFKLFRYPMTFDSLWRLTHSMSCCCCWGWRRFLHPQISKFQILFIILRVCYPDPVHWLLSGVIASWSILWHVNGQPLSCGVASC